MTSLCGFAHFFISSAPFRISAKSSVTKPSSTFCVPMDPSPNNPTLRRELGLLALIAYGVGDILGAGIYALVGKIAGVAGSGSWVAFAIALAIASLTALSYAELGSRYPRSGGEAHFCQEAFRFPSVSLLIGWLVLCSGVVSLATVSRAFAGYLLGLFSATPAVSAETMLIFLMLVVLGGINFWGIRQSSRTNIVCTIVEASGLLLVIIVGLMFFSRGTTQVAAPHGPVTSDWPSWFAISQGAALAFFAFIGFEDMVNVAEEVKEPERNLPLAIMAALLISGSVYIVVVWIATTVVPVAELAASQAPLLEVVRRAAPQIPPWSFATIALFAVANTGLLNFIMASRLLYGMAQQRLLPSWLGQVHATTRTPHYAIATVFAAALALAVSGTLVYLAGTTSVLLLLVFAAINLALVVVKRRDATAQQKFHVPLLVPITGAAASLLLIGFLPGASLLTATILIALGLVVVIVQGSRRRAKN